MGCSNHSNANLSVRSYVLEESKEVVKPSISLEKNNKFSFTCSELSSYIGLGSYEIDKDELILKTDDGKNQYIFSIKDETLVFNAEKSSEIPSFANIPNGAVFR